MRLKVYLPHITPEDPLIACDLLSVATGHAIIAKTAVYIMCNLQMGTVPCLLLTCMHNYVIMSLCAVCANTYFGVQDGTPNTKQYRCIHERMNDQLDEVKEECKSVDFISVRIVYS